MTAPLKFALIGCGPASRVHLAAWREIPGAQLAAVCDTDAAKAEAAAAAYGAATVYANAEQMLQSETLDFVDLTTPVHARVALVELAAKYKKHIISETPFAHSVAEAKALNTLCRDAGVRLMVHESLRFQPAMRAVKTTLSHPHAGRLYTGRITFRAPAALLTVRPGGAAQEQLVLQRFGLHLLDLARFYFGEAKALYCQTQTINPGLKGDDVASVMLRFASGATCVVDVNCASPAELVPATCMRLECEGGYVELGADFSLTRIIRGDVERSSHIANTPPTATPFSGLPFAWDAHFAATVALQTHWVEALRANTPPETSGADNLRSLALMLGAYESARTKQVFTP